MLWNAAFQVRIPSAAPIDTKKARRRRAFFVSIGAADGLGSVPPVRPKTSGSECRERARLRRSRAQPEG